MVEQVNEHLEDFDSGSAIALGENVEAEEHHRSGLGNAEGVADADRMAADEV